MFSQDELVQLFRNRQISAENSFDILKALCYSVSLSQEEFDPRVQELVLRAIDQKNHFEPYVDILNGLIRQLGLYPYLLDDGNLGIRDILAREFHRPSIIVNFEKNKEQNEHEQFYDDGIVFHRAQAEIFRRILDGESIILSAPTSFGKSAIIDSLIASCRFDNIAIVVPTLALIDEARRRLSKFNNSHKIITHASQLIAKRNIFIFTQERVVDYPEFPNIVYLF